MNISKPAKQRNRLYQDIAKKQIACHNFGSPVTSVVRSVYYRKVVLYHSVVDAGDNLKENRNETYSSIQLINQFVLLHLRVLIGPLMFTPLQSKQRLKFGTTNRLINILEMLNRTQDFIRKASSQCKINVSSA